MNFSFSKEFSDIGFTQLENAFLTEYMPESNGDAVRTYLYGLYLCQNAKTDVSIKEISEKLNLKEEEILDFFKYWEEFGLINILSYEPLAVKYLPIKSAVNSKPRKIKAEKYTDFTKAVQVAMPSRMISVNEYSEYFSIMETYSIKPEAMLMIINYCIGLKGNDVSYRYIAKVAKDFGNRELTTVEKVDKYLNTYVLHSKEINKILSAMSLRRHPELEDLNYLKKWTEELGFDLDNVVFSASKIKKGSMEKLDSFIMELYKANCYSSTEIENYLNKKQAVYDLTIKINRNLSHYEQIIETEIETYVNKWVSFGYDDETLLYLASACYKDGKNGLEDLDKLIEYLRNRGFITLSSVGDYFDGIKKDDEFIAKVLSNVGLNRRPTPWDRENLATWKSWNFSYDMILEASKLSSGKSSPIAYLNGILSNWKNKGVYSIEEVAVTIDSKMSPEDYNREYEKRRTYALSLAQKNLDKAMTVSGFKEVYARLNSIEKDLAFAEIANNEEALKSFESEKADLLIKEIKLLKEISLTPNDLKPKYSCEKCNDTGYVGSQRCDCL